MSENRQAWHELITWSQEHNLLAKKLYLVLSEPTGGLGPVLENLEDHVAFQTRLENEGVMFAAGPLSNDEETEWFGDGAFVYRAESRAEAVAVAECDPMHARGARSFVVRPWLLNEGTFGVRLFFSGGRPQIM
ncbi:YciI family protein [Actinacidiphila glaucinigra]|uniref:YciI family protein n=1 Tax=Actinacidiphila glaucinigra TaxID=235986 RepID=UPI0033BEC017